MRKATKGLLIAAAFVAVMGSGVAGAADRAGIGLEWGWAPTINLNGFDIDFAGSSFALSWKVTDFFTVGMVSNQGYYSGSHEYNDDTVTPNIKHNVRVDGNVNSSVLRILANIPALAFLQAGMEAGVVQLGAGSFTYVNSDGTAGSANDFGAVAGIPPTFPNISAAVIGVLGKINLVEAETKTVSAAISVTGGLRFTSLPDTYAFGSQETTTTTVPPKKIDPITNFNNISLSVSAGLWF